jgi:hypothetical protein
MEVRYTGVGAPHREHALHATYHRALHHLPNEEPRRDTAHHWYDDTGGREPPVPECAGVATSGCVR